MLFAALVAAATGAAKYSGALQSVPEGPVFGFVLAFLVGFNIFHIQVRLLLFYAKLSGWFSVLRYPSYTPGLNLFLGHSNSAC
tara:strand:+ start:3271 stop:3519 length:249 start_codon:yes stop_codon:yes gene_type:complete